MVTITFDQIRREEKRRKIKEEINSKVQKAKSWVYSNKEKLIPLIPIVAAGTGFLIKSSVKRANLNKQEAIKNNYCYDRSLGHYWKLRRELSNDEWREIDLKKRNGQKLSDILDDMKVLK